MDSWTPAGLGIFGIDDAIIIAAIAGGGAYFASKRSKVFRGAFNWLDRNVPGWSVVAGVLFPLLPLAPLLSAAVESASHSIGWAGQAVQFTQNGLALSDGSFLPLQASPIRLPTGLEQEFTNAYTQAAKLWASQGAQALEPLQYTLGRAVAKYEDEGGSIEANLKDLAFQVASGVAILLTIAIPIASLAGPGLAASLSLSALNLGLKAATEGRRLYLAQQYAAAIKKAARAVRAQAEAEAAQLDAETRALEAEIARVRAARAQLGRQVAARASAQPTSIGSLVALAAVALLVTEVLS